MIINMKKQVHFYLHVFTSIPVPLRVRLCRRNLHKSFPDPSSYYGLGIWRFQKANAEKGPAKTTAAANATKDIRSDGQSKTPNIESRVLQKIEFPQIFGKSEVRVLRNAFMPYANHQRITLLLAISCFNLN